MNRIWLRLARFSIADLLWLIAYAAIVTAIVALVVRARAVVIHRLSSDEAHADWESWRTQVRDDAQQPDRTVARRIPKSTEPPLLVLLRDYFATCLAAAVFFSSLLFLVTMIFARGASRTTNQTIHDIPPAPSGRKSG